MDICLDTQKLPKPHEDDLQFLNDTCQLNLMYNNILPTNRSLSHDRLTAELYMKLRE